MSRPVIQKSKVNLDCHCEESEGRRSNDIKFIFRILIQFYQILISPFFGQACRFYPSCSHYAAESIERHGVLQGIFYSAKRLAKCHPFSRGGYDPVKS